MWFKAGLLLAIVILFLFAGCATRYYPEPSEHVKVSDDFAVMQIGGISIAIQSKLWAREPHKVNDYFTTYYIIVINSSNERITISPDDLKLLDEERSQYDVLSYIKVAEVLLRDEFVMDKFSPFQDRSHQATDERVMARAYLMQDSFHYGEIMPNARKTGYIFFNRLSPKNERATIIFKNKEINFVRR